MYASTMAETDTSADRLSTDDARWDAVQRRDPSADGAFCYSVATTGVYCRPSCPSRRARRAHVAFHRTAADAERAGFRPCLRCRPDRPGLAVRRAQLVEAACRRIAAAVDGGDDAPSLGELAADAGLSRHHFHRLFRAATGVTPAAYLSARRAQRMEANLSKGASVTDALYDAGFGSSSRFYETAGERLGMTPTAWRDGGRGAVIRFAVGRCSLGAILVAATDKGVCAIQLGDDGEALAAGLEKRFPKARLVGGDSAFEALVARVIGVVEAPRRPCDLSLDVQGTAFQQQVWQALCAIPAGATATYAEIAARIGRPTAARAVARACATNPVAVVVPCHRVVRTGGGLGGYAGGIARKRDLLRREAGDRSGDGEA
jgi:AraC family transcriptional regulator of adaptative response/methylated-DNA-[protein]-cysteine methyltransferase